MRKQTKLVLIDRVMVRYLHLAHLQVFQLQEYNRTLENLMRKE